MKQYVMFELSRMGHGPKLRAFANEVNAFLFVLFSEDDILAMSRKARKKANKLERKAAKLERKLRKIEKKQQKQLKKYENQ